MDRRAIWLWPYPNWLEESDWRYTSCVGHLRAIIREHQFSGEKLQSIAAFRRSEGPAWIAKLSLPLPFLCLKKPQHSGRSSGNKWAPSQRALPVLLAKRWQLRSLRTASFACLQRASGTALAFLVTALNCKTALCMFSLCQCFCCDSSELQDCGIQVWLVLCRNQKQWQHYFTLKIHELLCWSCSLRWVSST